MIIRHMVGREIGELFPRHTTKHGAPLLKVVDLEVSPPEDSHVRLANIQFDVHEGEVLGIGGLTGAGRTELLMHLFGAWGRRVRGTVSVAGQFLDAKANPRRSLRAGLVLVSEDRKRFGLVTDKTVGFNLSLSSLRQLDSMGLIDSTREHRRNIDMFRSLAIKASGLEAKVGDLSGGNQQKVVLGKALLTQPRVILLDEPTRGIDIGAKVEIYGLMNRLTAAGCGIVLVSSELEELMSMSDRIIMLHNGRIGGTFGRGEATQEQLLAAAMGRSPITSSHASEHQETV
jgi:D-xylose transport system ATP-binding protein